MSNTLRTGGGERQTWADLPPPTRAMIEARLGAPVVRADSQIGGFSPGVAARLTTITSETVFLKAVSPVPNPDSPRFHRQEALVAAQLPPAAPVPRLRWSFDEGPDGWVVLVFEAIDGRMPALPWDDTELGLVLAAVDGLAETLTPSPVPEKVVGRVAETGLFRQRYWTNLRNDAPTALDAWSRRHLGALIALEADIAEATAGDSLVHMDMRADNILITERGVVVVDWPCAQIGASWLDLVCLAPSVAMQGGPLPEVLFARSATGRSVGPDALRSAVAGIAGFFTAMSLLPSVPGVPTLRQFQAAQGTVARAWLGRLAGLTEPRTE
jgi:aminoglycoside phosphotransferase (APT) family kinase protein